MDCLHSRGHPVHELYVCQHFGDWWRQGISSKWALPELLVRPLYISSRGLRSQAAGTSSSWSQQISVWQSRWIVVLHNLQWFNTQSVEALHSITSFSRQNKHKKYNSSLCPAEIHDLITVKLKSVDEDWFLFVGNHGGATCAWRQVHNLCEGQKRRTSPKRSWSIGYRFWFGFSRNHMWTVCKLATREKKTGYRRHFSTPSSRLKLFEH